MLERGEITAEERVAVDLHALVDAATTAELPAGTNGGPSGQTSNCCSHAVGLCYALVQTLRPRRATYRADVRACASDDAAVVTSSCTTVPMCSVVVTCSAASGAGGNCGGNSGAVMQTNPAKQPPPN